MVPQFMVLFAIVVELQVLYGGSTFKATQQVSTLCHELKESRGKKRRRRKGLKEGLKESFIC